MISVNLNGLNPLEKQIHQTLYGYAKSHDRCTIMEAAKLCHCSVSKISKFAKKLGFSGFKQYMDVMYGKELLTNCSSNELQRIRHFIDEFDYSLSETLLKLILAHEKIVFFAYGPSLLCAQYFEYRLRTCTNKHILAISDEVTLSSIADKKTLVIILTVTGKFQSFEEIYHKAKSKGCTVAMLVEEYSNVLLEQCDQIFCLTNYAQAAHLQPYEKSRTVFFIFLEEIIQQLQDCQRSSVENTNTQIS